YLPMSITSYSYYKWYGSGLLIPGEYHFYAFIYLPSNCLTRSSASSSLQVCLLNKNTIPHLAFSIFNLVVSHLYALYDVYIHLHGEYSHNHIHIPQCVLDILCTSFCHAFSQLSELLDQF